MMHKLVIPKGSLRAVTNDQGSFPSDPAASRSTEATAQIILNNHSADMTLTGSPDLGTASRSVEDGSTGPGNTDRGHEMNYPWRSDCIEIVGPSDSVLLCSADLHEQRYIPSTESSTRLEEDAYVSPAIAKLLEGGFDLRLEEDVEALPLTTEHSKAREAWSAGSQWVSEEHLEAAVGLAVEPYENADNIQHSVPKELVLDPGVDSNIFPFVMHGYVAWTNQFFFEPFRSLLPTKDLAYLWIKSDPHQAVLASQVGLVVSRSTDYDLVDFKAWENFVLEPITQARTRDMEGPEAMNAMRHSHKYITMLRLIGSLASVLKAMDFHAPVFRRACPELSNELVNLPRALTSNVNIQYYVTMDVLQSVVTHRPMFFRYNLEFLYPQVEEFLRTGGGPWNKMMWMYGIPDRLIVTFAKINILLEDFGNQVDPESVKELENEIESCRPIAWFDTGTHSAQVLGKSVMYESWKLAAYVYLYMGLCGVNSWDTRVVKVQKAFMRVLKGLKPTRYPESFMLLPMFILGMATNSVDQYVLLERLRGVTECSQPGTMANDVMNMLIHVWANAVGRPVRWSDIRHACLRVVGM
ncbi:unnamed protein product [Rhizoctonia solani]|uniref:Uncharacterized protein n=1 Tax=Rhizoctonia solani TaxID=456999 RepID=A0A8H3AXZ8_9AGAM|nr:unnamed protein product [Rhizoctonia solani]